jgi:hypothetical protein
LPTESRIEAANEEMAAIADVDAPPSDRRERLRAIWQPIIQGLVDLSEPPSARDGADPTYVGFTSDTHRQVFLEKATSSNGLVYRKFVVRRSEPRGPLAQRAPLDHKKI